MMPTIQVVAYDAPPHGLRIVRLPEGQVETPSVVPVPKEAKNAPDRAFRREGWIVFLPNEAVWGAPESLSGEAFMIGSWWDCVPALNPRTVWLGAAVDPNPNAGWDRSGPNVLQEYDGLQREVVRKREVDSGLRLEAVAEEGIVLRDDDARLVLVGDDGEAAELCQGHVLARHGSLLAIRQATWSESLEFGLRLLNLTTGVGVVVEPPLGGPWGIFASFSPDGGTLAIGIEEAPWPTEPDEAIKLVDKRKWTRLALIDATSATVRLAEGRFDNFAAAPVWTADGSWLVFDAPFDKSWFVCQVSHPEPSLVPVMKGPARPSPLAVAGPT
jgi:hypothetical protein